MYKPSSGARRRSDSRLDLVILIGRANTVTITLVSVALQVNTTLHSTVDDSLVCISGDWRNPPAQAISPMTACRLFLYMTYPDRQSGDYSVVGAFETKPVSLIIKITHLLIGLYFPDHEVRYDMMLPWALGDALRL